METTENLDIKPEERAGKIPLQRLVIWWARWWRTPPDKEDLFFTYIRETFQSIFPCKHKEWISHRVVVHGEDHGADRARRICKYCGEQQYLVYHRYGDMRMSWRKLPRFL